MIIYRGFTCRGKDKRKNIIFGFLMSENLYTHIFPTYKWGLSCLSRGGVDKRLIFLSLIKMNVPNKFWQTLLDYQVLIWNKFRRDILELLHTKSNISSFHTVLWNWRWMLNKWKSLIRFLAKLENTDPRPQASIMLTPKAWRRSLIIISYHLHLSNAFCSPIPITLGNSDALLDELNVAK